MFELQYENEKAIINIKKLETLIKIQKKKPEQGIKNVLNLISVFNAINMPEKTKMLLGEWIDIMKNIAHFKARLDFELVMLELTSCYSDFNNPNYKKKAKEARLILKDLDSYNKSINFPAPHELSFLYYRFGCLLQNNPHMMDDALNAVRSALVLAPDNPLYLTALTECMVMRNIDSAHHIIVLFRNTLENNIAKLEDLIGLGIDTIPAWFAVGRCHFFLGNRRECIIAYANAVSIILNKKFSSSCFIINTEIARTGRLKVYDEKLSDQILLYLNIAMMLSDLIKDKGLYRAALEETQFRKNPFKKPLVIVAGGASLMDTTKVESYKEYIEELMCGFKGTVICGGTTSGIPGLVGEIKKVLKSTTRIRFDLVAYLPENLPIDATKSVHYDFFYHTAAKEFSALDILTCWADIILSGINPADVKLIGINGGEMADLEYRIALSLGAKVCLVAYSGRAVSDIIQDPKWKNDPDLLQIPEDPLTVWAIVNQRKPTILNKYKIMILAPLVHEFYMNKRLHELDPETNDINKFKVVMPWDKLEKKLQDSNKLQVAFYEHILKRVNLGIRKSEKPVLFDIKNSLSKDDRDMLARLEHARWNAERLLEGWRYGPEKDLVNKLNPYLVAWEKLDDKIKPYDYDPVDNIPLMLEKIGYEVYKTRTRIKKQAMPSKKKPKIPVKS